MKTTKIIIISLMLSLVLTACSQKSTHATPEEPKLVKAIVVGGDESEFARNYPGRVSAGQKVNLSFIVSGPLIQLPVKEGDKIQKGQLIAQIDPKEFQLAAAQEKAKYDLAKVTYERYKILLPTDAISKSQYDEKKSIYELEKAQYEQALKSVADTSIYAPFSGIIAKRFVENYQYVQAKQDIVSLQDFSDLEIIINVPEADIARSSTIQRLKLETGKIAIGNASFATIPNTQFPVTIKEVGTEADPQTQTYQIKLRMPLPEKLIILPGMSATIAINFSAIDSNIIYIPVDAVMVNDNGKHYVWLIDKKTMTVHSHIVDIGQLQQDTAQILKGLKSGETIITAGGAYLQEGNKVKIIEGRIGR